MDFFQGNTFQNCTVNLISQGLPSFPGAGFTQGLPFGSSCCGTAANRAAGAASPLGLTPFGGLNPFGGSSKNNPFSQFFSGLNKLFNQLFGGQPSKDKHDKHDKPHKAHKGHKGHHGHRPRKPSSRPPRPVNNYYTYVNYNPFFNPFQDNSVTTQNVLAGGDANVTSI